ncbi:MAG: Tetratricopeptide 2 repeat protein [Candidatus Brocadiaceae bacterium]|nr:Tetratricopeptide 2 repeat protein [Candidatus Brocadiaceae bacterium]
MEKYYKVLEIHINATLREVTQAYRNMVKVWHPDRFPNDIKLQKKANEKLKEINEAYERIINHLKNPHKQQQSQQYERTEKQERQASQPPPSTDDIRVCPNCGTKNKILRGMPNEIATCWKCNQPLYHKKQAKQPPPRQTKPNKLYHLKKYWVLYLILGLILTGTIWDYIKPRLVDNADTSTKPYPTNIQERPPFKLVGMPDSPAGTSGERTPFKLVGMETTQKSLNDLISDKELNLSLQKLSDDELIDLYKRSSPVYKPPSMVSGLAQDVIVSANKIKQKSRDLFNNKNQTPKPLSKQDTNKKHSDIVDPYDNKTQTSAKLPVLENNPQQTPKVKDIWHETISDPEFKALDFSSKRRVVDGFMDKFIIPDAGYQALPEERKANILHQFERDAGIANEDDNASKTSELPSTEKMIGDTKTRPDTELGGSYFKRGNDKYDSQDYTGAVKDYSKAIELNPKYASTYNNRGSAKAKLQDYTGAIQDYSKAIELNPKYASAYNNRGNAKESLKDKQGALADYSKAGELGYTKAYEDIQRIQKGN